MGIRQMQGTPAHLEYIGPNGRKRRSDCKYYIEGICHCNKAQSFMMKCVGRLCCSYYHESKGEKTLSKKKLTNSMKKFKLNNPNYKYKVTKCNNEQKTRDILKSKEMPQELKKQHPLINKRIILKSEKSNKLLIMKIVAKGEDNPFEKLFSEKSKMSKALIGKNIGDNIKVNLANNNMEYTILSIE